MDIKQLLEKIDQFAGQAVGQKPGDQWRGTDAAPPGKKLVGDSMLKDLSKGKTPKSKEQELSEEFQAFLEAEFKDTVDKRPSRKGARHSRGHEPKSGYKTIKADEAVGKGIDYHDQIPIKSVMQGLNVDYNRKTNQTVLSYKGQPIETFIYDGIPTLGYFNVAVDHKVAELMKLGKIPKMPSLARNRSSQPQTYNLDQEYSHGIDLPKNVQQQMFQQHDQDTENYGMVSVSNPAKWANVKAKKEKEKEKQQKVAESMSDKDIELQDYRSMSHKEFQTAYKMTKTEWINKNKSLVIQNPSIKKALGLDEGADTEYTVNMDRNGKIRSTSGTIAELLDYFGYTLEVGKSYEHEKGRYKINLNPKSIGQLVDALNKAASNGAANGAASTHYSTGGQMFDEGVPYKATNPHPASKDPIVAKVLKQMRPGLTGLDMNNEAFLYFAYEIGKMRAREMWEDYGPAIKYFYQSGIGVNEGWESGPEEYEEPYDDADDAYDRQRQEKIDTEAEKEWAKLPKVSTYKLIGRGPNMEPNYEFGDEFDTLEQAVEYRAEIMKDPKTPHPEHIGIRTITRVIDKEQTNEAVTPPGSGIVKNIDDYIRRRDEIFKALSDPKQKDNYPWYKQALFDLNRMAKQAGIKIEESRAHKQLATWFQNRERAQKYASGELKVPTPQERQAQLKQLEKAKPVKEYGANNISPYGQPTQKVDPKQAQQVAANLNVQKTALNQLKQINPEIDPQKAATAMTKDLASMSPQEKEELAQIGKTVSPALGTPAFGSIKTAIQKSQIK